MHEVIPGARVEGEVLLDGDDLYGPGVDPVRGASPGRAWSSSARTRSPRCRSSDNVLAGVKLNNQRMSSKPTPTSCVEKSLRGANLWNEVKDRLDKPGSGLSGGQQQRLCIARAIAVQPEVLLMDEPCSALDPISTFAIEDLIEELKEDYTIVIVTHNMQQAARVSDRTAFFNIAGTGKPGKLIEMRHHGHDLLQPGAAGHRGLRLRPLRLIHSSCRSSPVRKHPGGARQFSRIRPTRAAGGYGARVPSSSSAPELSSGTGRVGIRWFAPFTLAWLALWTVQLTPLQLLIPLQLNTPGDADGWIRGVVQSGLVLGVGGLAAIVAGPLAGALSDRTRSRLGRRRPWALAGTALATASLLALAFAVGPLAVGAAWVGVMVGFAVASSAFTALIADQLTGQRGAASAAVGSAQAIGIVLGVGVVVVSGVGLLGGYLLLAGLMAIGGTLGALLLPDPVPAGPALPIDPTGLSVTSDVLGDGDFVRMLLGRLTGNLGNALGTGLLLFFLMFGIGQPPADAESNLLLLIVVYTVFVVAASVIGGLVSDRTGRRKSMVVVSALIQAVAALIIAVAPTLPVTLVAAALIGVGYGIFNAGGLALATDLLPGQDANAQDLGIVNVSANLGQLLGPVVGAGLIAAVGGFWLLFVAAAVFSVAGAALTATVRVPSPAPKPT